MTSCVDNRTLQPVVEASPAVAETTVSSGTAPPPDHYRDPCSPPAVTCSHELMGPILRRKKVVSMPLGATGDFFFRDNAQGVHIIPTFDQNVTLNKTEGRRSARQLSHTGHAAKVSNLDSNSPPSSPRPRSRQNSRQNAGAAGIISGVLRRKQVSLDLLGPNDFFAQHMEVEDLLPSTPELENVIEETVGKSDEAATGKSSSKLIRPLRFAPRMVPKMTSRGHGVGHGGDFSALPREKDTGIDKETRESFESYTRACADLKLQLSSLTNRLKEGVEMTSVSECIVSINDTYANLESKENFLKSKFIAPDSSHHGTSPISNEISLEDMKKSDGGLETNPEDNVIAVDAQDDGIIRATRADKIKFIFLFCLMLAVTIIVATWHTELDEESVIQGPVGMACVTDCLGDVESRDFFHGHNHFEKGQVIQLTIHLDQNEVAYDRGAFVIVEVYGTETKSVKAKQTFGPPDDEERLHRTETITVDFDDPQEAHVINVYGSEEEIPISFTLSAHVLSGLANNSELVAALIMILVYAFILLEVIHRTLVAIFGSMIALLLFFIMHEGTTESIAHIMLHLEWSTLGLLFGMMLLVGELSHTGIFEWCAVRLLVASNGSFVRLMVLLCTLTAVASAFLDNVTTMLLIAPVTIDMCSILDVDPRPYLIGEVMLSNIGGTATLIGDPPNIIIGSSFEEIGFIDFIIHVFPCIFVFCVPASLAMVCWIYRYYLTAVKMKVLDTETLKKTYPIYDQPRLMFAGTSTFFVILMFFLHPVHHKDTAWIALLGAFITIAFTNPHDVQDALRSHVEWDTLLFFAGLFVLVEVCAAMGLLSLIGNTLASYIQDQPEENQLSVAITLLIWVSAITSAFLDNIPYTATMIPIVKILAQELPDTLPVETLAWALSFGACLGGNGTLLGASSNIVTAGLSTNKGFEISFLNFSYPGMLIMFVTVAISNIYMLVRYVWI